MMNLKSLDARIEERLSGRIAVRIATKREPAIKRIELFLTDRCTLRCDYCFVAEKNVSERMTWSVAAAAVDMLIRESRGEKDLSIVFIGGEPLLEFTLMRRVVEYANSMAAKNGKKVGCSVTTNGTIMSREIALFGQEHGFNYLLSLDGDRQFHDLHRKTANGTGSWDLIMGANLDILKSIQPWIGARMTVSPDTVSKLSNGVQLLYERGVNQFIIGPNEDVEWIPEHLAVLEIQTRALAEFCTVERSKGSPIRISFLEFGRRGITK